MQTSVSFSREELLSRIDMGKLQPSIKNSEFTISEILGFMLSGMTIEDIMFTYPELEREDVMATLFYAMQLANVQGISDN